MADPGATQGTSGRSFWLTLPGVLTGTATVIAAAGTLIGALVAANVIHPIASPTPSPTAVPPAELAVANILVVPSVVDVTQSFSVAVSVKNSGASIAAPFDLNVFLQDPVGDRRLLDKVTYRDRLKPDSEVTAYERAGVRLTCAGTWRLSVEILASSADLVSSNPTTRDISATGLVFCARLLLPSSRP